MADIEVRERAAGIISYSHNDTDGKAASYMIHKLLDKIGIPNEPGNFKTMTYDDPFDEHEDDDIVFITDLSFTKQTYTKLVDVCKTAKFVFWIDHHKSSKDITSLNPWRDELNAIPNLVYWVDTGFCGAFLSMVFRNMIDSMEELEAIMNSPYVCFDIFRHSGLMPVYTAMCALGTSKEDSAVKDIFWEDTIGQNHPIRLIDDHDRWTKENEENATAFNLGIGLDRTTVTIYNKKLNRRVFNPMWGQLFDEGDGGKRKTKEAIAAGNTIRRYLENRYAGELNKNFGEIYFPGIGTYMVMNNRGNSWCFGEKYEHYAGSILWSFNEQTQKYIYSIYVPDAYQDKMPAVKFAEMFGGGGHPGAAGWSSDHRMFLSGQGGPGAQREDLENVKYRLWYGPDIADESHINMITKMWERYSKTIIDPNYVYPEIEFCFRDYNTIIGTAEPSKDYIDVICCPIQHGGEIFESLEKGNIKNPFPIFYDMDETKDYDLDNWIVTCLEDIINDFLID